MLATAFLNHCIRTISELDTYQSIARFTIENELSPLTKDFIWGSVFQTRTPRLLIPYLLVQEAESRNQDGSIPASVIETAKFAKPYRELITDIENTVRLAMETSTLVIK
jgi:hypothetical protein